MCQQHALVDSRRECKARRERRTLNLNLPQPEAPIYQVAGRSTPPITLATGPTAAGRSGSNDGMFTKDNEQYQPHWLTGSKAHQYLGLGALALVALAAVSPKEEDSAHEYFAVSATALAAGAATTGFIPVSHRPHRA